MAKAPELEKETSVLQLRGRKSQARRPRRRPQFSYPDCLAGTQDFRLLEFIPAPSLKADMHCRLQRYPLSSSRCPEYNALSYTWGDSSDDKQRITLNGLAFFVTANLLGALRRLRLQQPSRLVWVDAICINQDDDNEEKNTQVPMMRHIYSSAACVLVWLGEASSDSGSAIDFLPTLTKVARIDKAELWLERLNNHDFLRKLFSVACLFHRPWWSRTWVIQEVALAKEAVVLCGGRQIPWPDIYNFVTAWMDITFSSHRGTLYNSYSEPEFNDLQNLVLRFMGAALATSTEALSHMRRDWQVSSAKRPTAILSSLLWSFKNAQVSNPKDKIYGLLGLVRQVDRNWIKVDYNLTVENLYNGVFRSFLLDDNGFDSFRWMTGESMVTKTNKAKALVMPSWVPNFGPRGIFPISSFVADPSRERNRFFAASGSDRSRSRSKPLIQFESDYQILLATGCVVDTVRYLGRVCPGRDELNLERQSLRPTMSEWGRLAGKRRWKRYPGLADAFWRTVLADRQIEGFHFRDRAGRFPAKRLGPHAKYVPPKNSSEEDQLLNAMGRRGIINGSAGRRFGVTANGFFGLLPETTTKGDSVCVLLGGEVPFVLRKLENRCYEMIGECYVHDIMDGEAVRAGPDGQYESFKIQ